MSKKYVLGAAVILSLLLSSLTVVSDAYCSPICREEGPPAPLPRLSPLNITVVFIGFDQQCINTTYLTWLLPQSKPETAIASSSNWGVNYSLAYSYVFTNQSFLANLENYLTGINRTFPVPWPFLTNPYLPFLPGPTANIFYNANRVEEYLYSRLTGINAIPSRGYTAVMMNLSRPWNYVITPPGGQGNMFPHYYNVTYYDKDLGTMWYGGQMFGQWMLGWGGHHRFWIMDLSAGAWPTGNQWYWQYSFWPIWYLVQQYPGLGGFRTTAGINFLTEYVSDFVKGIVNDLFAPDLQFDLRPSDRYEVVIYALDNGTRLLNQTIPLINTTMIRDSLSSLIPYAAWSVNITYVMLNGTTDPEPYGSLWTTIRNAEWPFAGPSVDFYALWSYFEDKMSSFITSRPDRVTIPVFVLQFNGSYQLSWQIKGAPQGQVPGASVYNMTIIGRPAQPTATPTGVTQTVIHEVGHILGLAHPHLYDALQDFTSTVMSYYAHDYEFSQFDKDTISRGHADFFMIKATALIDNATDTLIGKETNSTVLDYLDWARGNTTAAEQHYQTMDYAEAVADGRTAQANAIIAAQMAQQLPMQTPLDTTSTISFYQSLTIGLFGLTLVMGLVIYVMRRRKTGTAVKTGKR